MLKRFGKFLFVFLIPLFSAFADIKYEAEDLLINKDVLLENRIAPNKWNLMSNDTDAMKKWSKGIVIQSPPIMRDSQAGEVLPILKFTIPLPDNGEYNIKGLAHRAIGVSLDGGKTWKKSKDGNLATRVKAVNGGVQLWIAGCFVNDGNPGSCYVDYFIVTKAPKLGKVEITYSEEMKKLIAEIRAGEIKKYSIEAEDVLQNPDALVYDKYQSNRWALLTNDTDAMKKWSKGVVIQSPPIMHDSQAGEVLPILKFAIPLPDNGEYNIKGLAHRTIGVSLDNGKTWSKSSDGKLASNVKAVNGYVQLWIAGCFVNDGNPGSCYVDYFTITPAKVKKKLKISDLQSFTLPDGRTQISYLTSIPVKKAKIVVEKENGETFEIIENFDYLRNHAIILPPDKISIGEKAICQVIYPQLKSEKLAFEAGKVHQIEKSKAFRIKLKIHEKSSLSRRNFFVRSGIPFNKGVLANTKDCQIENSDGDIIPAYFEVFARHQDGSIKWLIVNFQANTIKNDSCCYYLSNSNSKISQLTENEEIAADFNTILSHLKGVITLANGKKIIADCAYAKITKKLHTSVFDLMVINGKFSNSTFAYNLEIYRYPNKFFEVKWRIINHSSNPISLIESFYWQGLPYKGEKINLTQLHEKKAVANGTSLEFVDGIIKGENSAVFVKNFRQLYPKSLDAASKNGISIGILPKLPGNYLSGKESNLELLRDYFWYEKGLYKFKSNMNLCGEFFYTTENIDDFYLGHLENPLFAAASPEYYCSSGAFGNVMAREKGFFDNYEEAIDRNFKRFLAMRDRHHEYGWMSFGDWFGERKYNWGNNEYDVTALCATQFVRTGELTYLKRSDEMTNHYTSTDFVDYGQLKPQKELIFCHSIGHTGSFIDKQNKKFNNLGIIPLFFDGCLDFYGGHDHQQGTFLTACLMGNKRYFEVAEQAAAAQAFFMTPDFSILIERSAGWALANAVYAYEFTNNPIFLNAAKIYFEEIKLQQNPKTGGLDLEQDASECTCMDRKEHIGGKPFAVGVLMHSIGKYYEISGDKEAKKSLILMADWLLNYAYDSENGNFRYKTGCPQYSKGTWFPKIITEGIAYAGYLSKNSKYCEFLVAHSGKVLGKDYGNVGKEFAQEFRALPYLFYFLRKQNINNIKNNGPILAKNTSQIKFLDGIIIEGEFFADEFGGAIQFHTNKINASKVCIYCWNHKGHGLTYEADIPESGKYIIFLRCASNETAQRKFTLNGKEIGIFNFAPNRGMCNKSDDWVLVPISQNGKIMQFELPKGKNRLTFENVDGVPLNLDYINLQKVGN